MYYPASMKEINNYICFHSIGSSIFFDKNNSSDFCSGYDRIPYIRPALPQITIVKTG